MGASVLLGGSAGDEVGCCGDGYGDGADEPTKREGNRVSGLDLVGFVIIFFVLFTHLRSTTSTLKIVCRARERGQKRLVYMSGYPFLPSRLPSLPPIACIACVG